MRKGILLFIFFTSAFVFGQKASITLDRTELRIGEQTVLHLLFEYENPTGNALIIWPEFSDKLTKNIEVIDKTIDIETLVDSASASYIREQKIKITGFERGNFVIPSQKIQLGDSIFSSNSLTIMIETVEVDTSKGITDIKPIYTVDYPISERSKDWLFKNWLWITIPLVLILLYFIRSYLKQRKTNSIIEKEPEIIIPAHILALETLEKLLQHEEWKSAEKKTYYSDLTNTVRTYLENRFDIHAMEQTTREIITDLKHASINEDDKVYLRKILREADMVKFAKFNPNDEEALAYLNKSIDFVKRTKEQESDSNGN